MVLREKKVKLSPISCINHTLSFVLHVCERHINVCRPRLSLYGAEVSWLFQTYTVSLVNAASVIALLTVSKVKFYARRHV